MSITTQKPGLDEALQGRVVVLGVGNELRGDDGFGPALVRRLAAHGVCPCFDGGSAPENYLGPIARQKPDTVLIADATDLGLEPGACALLARGDVAVSGLTTHGYSLGLLIDFLETTCGAAVYLLAVQPAAVALEEGLSQPVTETLDTLMGELVDRLT